MTETRALKPGMWGEVKIEELDGSRTRENPLEEDDEAGSQRRPLMGGDRNDSDSEGSGSVCSQRQAHFTRSNNGGDSSRRGRMRAGHGHCCFTSGEVVTPSPTKMYM